MITTDSTPNGDAVLVITGAARGIGAATATLAAAEGWRLALLDRDATAVKQRAESIRGEGGVATGLVCDVADEQQVGEAFAEVAARLGPVRGLVSCAGVDRGGPVHDLPSVAWDEVMAVNLRGTFLSCREALRGMRPRGGAIVCLSSPFAVVAAGGVAAYGASKAGVCALVRSLAVDYAADGIRVNALLPGPTDTELMWANVPADAIGVTRAQVCDEVPLARLADPAEIARAALWLLSDDASYVTGAQLACDGGVLARAPVSV